MSKKVACVIPARLASTRFPRKVLAPLGGKPLIQWAYEGAMKTGLFDQVVLAVDCIELLEAAKAFGGEAILTDPNCQSGTDRLVELDQKKKLQADIWVNWQGDEPFITKEMIETLLQSTGEPGEEIWTLKRKIDKPEEITSQNVVKVVCDQSKRALYFSRNPIPANEKNIYKHIGIYAYSADALKRIASLEPSPLEKAEKLEQLRFLDNGMSIHVHETYQEIFGIDTKEELALAESLCYTFT
ncbi:MAG: 3-deoxy-manno-octulosonate cytidylyltransferase [Chlamydiae bacterium]|nr:3-deoxy-manno-octulosonate cytidylyltransferase [Chlamydiota bacterium]